MHNTCNIIIISIVVKPIARIFAGGVCMSASGAKYRVLQVRARGGAGGIVPQKILKKWVI